jgi:hypothetical protein
VLLRVKLEPGKDSEEKLRMDGLERLLRFGREVEALADGVEGYT